MNHINIEQTQNGFIMRVTNPFDQEGGEVMVFEAYESDKQAFAALVMALAENVVFLHDKWKNDNIRVSWDGLGSKFVESDEK